MIVYTSDGYLYQYEVVTQSRDTAMCSCYEKYHKQSLFSQSNGKCPICFRRLLLSDLSPIYTQSNVVTPNDFTIKQVIPLNRISLSHLGYTPLSITLLPPEYSLSSLSPLSSPSPSPSPSPISTPSCLIHTSGRHLLLLLLSSATCSTIAHSVDFFGISTLFPSIEHETAVCDDEVKEGERDDNSSWIVRWFGGKTKKRDTHSRSSSSPNPAAPSFPPSLSLSPHSHSPSLSATTSLSPALSSPFSHKASLSLSSTKNSVYFPRNSFDRMIWTCGSDGCLIYTMIPSLFDPPSPVATISKSENDRDGDVLDTSRQISIAKLFRSSVIFESDPEVFPICLVVRKGALLCGMRSLSFLSLTSLSPSFCVSFSQLSLPVVKRRVIIIFPPLPSFSAQSHSFTLFCERLWTFKTTLCPNIISVNR
jgi:hypothetical protein